MCIFVYLFLSLLYLTIGELKIVSFVLFGEVLRFLTEKKINRIKSNRSKGRNYDKGSFDIIKYFYYLYIVVIGLHPFFASQDIYEKSIFLPILIYSLGFAIRLKAFQDLGKFFNLRIIILDNHQFIHSGVYKYIQHPLYLGIFLIYSSYAMLMRSLIATIYIVCLFIPVYLYRIRLEENALEMKFGKTYTDYSKNTKKIIPFLW